jgi:predicted CopG family antitoxin
MLERNTKQKTNGLTTIAVSYENYQALKELGRTGDTFNDVVSQLLRNAAAER